MKRVVTVLVAAVAVTSVWTGSATANRDGARSGADASDAGGAGGRA